MMLFSTQAIIQLRYTGRLYCRVCVLVSKSNKHINSSLWHGKELRKFALKNHKRDARYLLSIPEWILSFIMKPAN